MNTRRLLGAGALMTMLMGCGEPSSGRLDIQNFPLKYAEAYCAKRLDCCSSDEFPEASLLGSFETIEGCEATVGGLLLAFFPNEESVTLERLDFDRGAARSAVSEVTNLSCADAFGTGDFVADIALEDIFTGLVEAGGECQRTIECAEGYCSDSSRCAAPVGNGGECDEDEQCSSGICSGGECVGSLTATGERCFFNSECATGFCDSDVIIDGECANPKPAGQDCNGDAACASGNCDGGVCAAPICQG